IGGREPSSSETRPLTGRPPRLLRLPRGMDDPTGGPSGTRCSLGPTQGRRWRVKISSRNPGRRCEEPRREPPPGISEELTGAVRLLAESRAARASTLDLHRENRAPRSELREARAGLAETVARSIAL